MCVCNLVVNFAVSLRAGRFVAGAGTVAGDPPPSSCLSTRLTLLNPGTLVVSSSRKSFLTSLESRSVTQTGAVVLSLGVTDVVVRQYSTKVTGDVWGDA